MTASPVPVRICVITTTPYVVNVFLKRHLAALAGRYEVTLALNTEDAYRLETDTDDVHLVLLLEQPVQGPARR